MSGSKILVVVGARPQFIKAAAISRAFAQFEGGDDVVIATRLVHTGQHYDRELSDVFFQELDIPDPDENLGVGSGPHGVQTARMLERLERTIQAQRSDVVLVLGDTNSTLAGALAAAKLHVPVAHVEAGLRSYRREMPEEVNRVVTDHLATLLFCPSDRAVENLRTEGITEGVHEVGDVMFDVLRRHLPGPEERRKILAELGIADLAFALATIHRAENTQDPATLAALITSLGRVAAEAVPVVFPIHPRTWKALGAPTAPPGVRLLPPVTYRQMLSLEASSRVILTDSGGVQKEAYWLGVPCVTLRRETEWVETLELGWNVLASSEPEIVAAVARGAPPGSQRPPLYGEGDAAERIVRTIVTWMLGSKDPAPGAVAVT